MMQDYVQTAVEEAEDTTYYVDIGPFFDRFGLAQLAVLASTNPTVKAWIQSVMVRKWINVKHPFVEMGIDAIITAGVAGVDTAMRDAIISTPATKAEQSALLKLYFQ